MASMRFKVPAAALMVAIAAPMLPGSAGPASAQERFWEKDDGSSEARRTARARRDDALRAPDDPNAPSGGFGRQADVNGQPWDGRSGVGGYGGAPAGSGTAGNGGYAGGPDYSRPPAYSGPEYNQQQAQGYGAPPYDSGGQQPDYRAPPPAYSPPPAAAPGYGGPGYGAPKANDPYANGTYGPGASGNPTSGYGRQNDAYRPPQQGGYADTRPSQQGGYADTGGNDVYRPNGGQGYGTPYPADQAGGQAGGGYGQPYSPPVTSPNDGYGPSRASNDGQWDDRRGGGSRGTYSQNEVVDTGHRFFGSVSQGIASAIESIFKRQGRPNGYILGEDAGGAFVAGLRYGEGMLSTKDAGNHRVYWQGPSLGYDFGGEGSKTMVLVYNLRDPSDMYHRFGGVQGAAYLVGGVSVQFQQHEHVTLAVIRSGVGLRLGANVGYLKYSRRPTWNPF